MLPKKIRLTTALFDQVYKLGKVQHSRSFLVRSTPLPSGSLSRFAVAVSKKVAPTAVLRNKIKRIVYNAVEGVCGQDSTPQPSCMTIFGVKSDISKVPSTEIIKEVESLLLKKDQK